MNNFILDILAFGAILSGILVITSKNPVIAVVFLISLFINAAGYLIISGIKFVGISYIVLYVGAITVLFLFVIMMLNIELADIIEVGSQYTKNLPLAIVISSLFIFEIYSVLSGPNKALLDISAPQISTLYPWKLVGEILNIPLNFIDKINDLLFNNIFTSGTDTALRFREQDLDSSKIWSASQKGVDGLTNIFASVNKLTSNLFEGGVQIYNPSIADTTIFKFLQIEALGQSLYTTEAFWLIIVSFILLLAMVAPILISRRNNTN
jgi:NADH-ubiquinone oxidoreductase chain 6